jgi:hypothetical protein
MHCSDTWVGKLQQAGRRTSAPRWFMVFTTSGYLHRQVGQPGDGLPKGRPTRAINVLQPINEHHWPAMCFHAIQGRRYE